MDEVVSNDVIKRRLPPWMLGVAAPVDEGRVGNSKNDDDGGGGDEEKAKKRGGRRRKAAQGKRDNFSDGLELEEAKGESSAPVAKRGDRKQTKRKLNLDIEDAPERKRGKGRPKKSIQRSEDGFTGGCLEENSEDEDLTMEDLMIFAKECVQGDIAAKEVESVKEDEFGDTVQSGNSIDVQEKNKGVSEGQEISSSGVTMGNVNENVKSEGSGCKLSMSGDPTQDMLDLLLGPLLKKTQEKENKKVDFTEDMDFNFDMKRQGTGTAALGEEQATAPVTKKKISLRDRVAMLLD